MKIKSFLMHYDGHEPIACCVPCSMYSVLLENKLISDPFCGLNEQEATKLSEKDVEFSAEFDVDEDMLASEYNELVFHGLDTICDIYLNEKLLGKTKNMHRTYSYDVKSGLRLGSNSLKLAFRSPIKFFEEMNHRHYMPCCLEGMDGTPHLRKALYMSGWDWGPTLPDMGIFRDIELLSYNTDKIDSYYVRQHHDGGAVTLDFTVETKHGADVDVFVEIDGKRYKTDGGAVSVRIGDPKLWWPLGYGEQNLYGVKITAEKNGVLVDSKSDRIGLRTVSVSRNRDKYGREFAFVVNGVKIFAKGANYIPNDNILPRIDRAKIKSILDAAVFANFNCMRVWGGGYYPEDEFYDMCDELGLLVWQDIMVACAAIWLTDDMKEEFRCEAVDNIKRFRNHASFALLCGNNEIEDQMEHEIWGKNLQYKTDYIMLYENLLADIAYKYVPDTFYWPSSPSSGGGLSKANCDDDGDAHYWDVWHGEKPVKEYRKHMFRFCSEFGFQSFPPMKTIRYFATEEDLNPFSRVMEAHQKNASGNKKILTYLSDTYKYPYDFEDLVYASELLQAEAIKCGVEHFRRIRECCKGSIYWQINDCWPVASWSSVDYFGRYKALHYFAKKFYAPVLCSIFIQDGEITVSVMNETLKDFSGELRVKLCKTDFACIMEEAAPVSIKQLTSSDIITIDMPSEGIYDTYCVAELYDEHGELVMRQSDTLALPKHFNFTKPNISCKVISDDEDRYIELKSDTYAKNVFIDFTSSDVILSDNYFDLTGDAYRVKLISGAPDDIESQIVIKTVYDI